MKKNIFLIISVALMILSVACGNDKNEKVLSVGDGKVKVTQEKGGQVHEVKVTTEEGTTTFKMGSNSLPKDLGVSIYPGAKVLNAGTWSGSEKGEEFSTTMLFSQDSFKQVSAFYKKNLKKESSQIMDMEMPTGRMTNITIKQDNDISINIILTESRDNDGTNIQISKVHN